MDGVVSFKVASFIAAPPPPHVYTDARITEAIVTGYEHACLAQFPSCKEFEEV